MEFCPKCGAIITVENKKAVCTSCNYRLKKKPKIEVSEKIVKHDSIAVINEEADNTYPMVEIKCQKCSNKKAYFWTKQTRAADESETKFYKCTDPKCRHTWRVYT